ncbi:Uncharacterized protein APZ42_007108, partial [Daphnia magna]
NSPFTALELNPLSRFQLISLLYSGFIKSECQLHLTSLKQQVIMLILKMFSIYKV